MSHRVYRRHEIELPPSQASTATLRPESTDHYTTGEELGVTDTARWVRNIYEYHVETLGWDDIGYHLLYDRFGRIFEGRPLDRIGAHAGGTGEGNTTVGCAFLGDDDPNYQDVTPEARSARAHIDRMLRSHFGRTGALDAYHLHRDWRATSCPGDEIASEVVPALADGTLAPDPIRVLRQALVGVTQTDLDQAATWAGPYRWATVRAEPGGQHRLVWGAGDVGEEVAVEVAVAVGKAASLDGDEYGWDDALRIAGVDRFDTGGRLLRTALAHPPGTEARRGRPW